MNKLKVFLWAYAISASLISTKFALTIQESSDDTRDTTQSSETVSKTEKPKKKGAIASLKKGARTFKAKLQGGIKDLKGIATYSGTQEPKESFVDLAGAGKLKQIKALHKVGFDGNTADPYGLTALINAVIHGQVEVVRYFIETGADVNHAAAEGLTPLIAAARNGRQKIVSLLLEAGSSREHTDDKGFTALDYAKGRKDTAIIALLDFDTETEITPEKP